MFGIHRSRSAGALGRDNLEWVSFPNRLDMASQPIRDARCQVLNNWRIRTDPLDYLLPLARLAPVQCTGWGTLARPVFVLWITISPAGSWEPPRPSRTTPRPCIALRPFPRGSRESPSRPQPSALQGCREQVTCICARIAWRNCIPTWMSCSAVCSRATPADGLCCWRGRHRRSVELLQQLRPDVGAIGQTGHLPARHHVGGFPPSAVARRCAPGHTPLQCRPRRLRRLFAGPADRDLTRPIQRRPVHAGVCRHMELEQLVSHSTDEYISHAVRLATDDDYSHAVHLLIAQRAAVLFEDAQAVRSYEQFFETAQARPSGSRLHSVRPAIRTTPPR